LLLIEIAVKQLQTAFSHPEVNEMKLSRRRPVLLGIFALIFSLLPVSALAQATKLDEVHSAIRQQGAQWIAGETSNLQYSEEETLRRAGGSLQPPLSGTEPAAPMLVPPASLPASYDWRQVNGRSYVSGIRDQGSCGSCWAFATTAALESYHAIYTGWSPNFSEQVMVSCSGAGAPPENPCRAGYTNKAAAFLKSTGLPVESCYPYTAKNGNCGNACANWQADAFRIDNWSSISRNVDAIKSALYTYGPLVTQMEIYEDFYYYYRSGVYSYTGGGYIGGHAILIVGYDDNRQCFICKNSWGSGWGESGYFRIAYSQVTRYGTYNYIFASYNIAYLRNPHLASTPATLETYCRVGQNAVSRSFMVWNDGGGTLNYSVSKNQSWLSPSPSSGSISGWGAANIITVNFATANLAKGRYTANITVNGAGGTQNIPVYLRLIEPGPPMPWQLPLLE
jgi:C1A family cysteine protease